MAAVITAQHPLRTVEPVAEMTASVLDCSLPLFSHSIDHVPWPSRSA